MSRIARLVLPGYPHHVTQRGNYQQQVFKTDADYGFYLGLINKYAREYSLAVLSFCLMPNHIHFICVPENKDSLANTFKVTHTVYSQYFNAKNKLKGHLWQGRFYSSILDEEYLCAAVRYVERNPVRATLAQNPWDWKWSSAHSRVREEVCKIALSDITQFVKIGNWVNYLGEQDERGIVKVIKNSALAGRPYGNDAFVAKIEKIFNISLLPAKRGRPRQNN